MDMCPRPQCALLSNFMRNRSGAALQALWAADQGSQLLVVLLLGAHRGQA